MSLDIPNSKSSGVAQDKGKKKRMQGVVLDLANPDASLPLGPTAGGAAPPPATNAWGTGGAAPKAWGFSGGSEPISSHGADSWSSGAGFGGGGSGSGSGFGEFTRVELPSAGGGFPTLGDVLDPMAGLGDAFDPERPMMISQHSQVVSPPSVVLRNFLIFPNGDAGQASSSVIAQRGLSVGCHDDPSSWATPPLTASPPCVVRPTAPHFPCTAAHLALCRTKNQE
jgi:hypothetical protein